MTTNLNASDHLRTLSLFARLANNERLTAADVATLRHYLDRSGAAPTDASGFPEAASGDTGDLNSLRRTNWFNGRYLTAESLSRQDVYFDHRARLNAHALMPGIAWGLGIAIKEIKTSANPPPWPGFSSASLLTLKRGLAFDGVGRPILVSRDFEFSLDDLIGVALKTPRRVVGGQREFMPCVCLAPDPGGASGGSAALPSGPFLLVIEAGERPQGKAKVTGDVCGGRSSAPCEADVWQGSFGLSLVRFPVDVPLDEGSDPWALRGTLSAYYFDAFEHPLWQRWNPNFPVDASFTSDSGPERQEGLAIPLALVHLDGKGAALFLDSWIPRRLITATPGEDWHRTRFGAPPRAAAWARIHQFQAMLAESLKQRPMGPGQAGEGNLYARGFRHLPPMGLLPVVLDDWTHDLAKQRQALPQKAAMAREALRQAEAYFAGTNVLTYGVVALHDDDILEDLHNVIDKDPLQLEPARPQEKDPTIPADPGRDALVRLLVKLGLPFLSGGQNSRSPARSALQILFALGLLLRTKGLEIDALVNRHVEVVKLVVPLQGLSRQHPLLGVIAEAATAQASAWGSEAPAHASAASFAGLPWKRDGDASPRSFVVYVKQRLVLLELVLLVVEVLEMAVQLALNSRASSRLDVSASQINVQEPFIAGSSTEGFSRGFQAMPQANQKLALSVVSQPSFQQAWLPVMAANAPYLTAPGLAKLLKDQTDHAIAAAPSANREDVMRQTLAQAADAIEAESPDGQWLQLLAAMLPPEQTLDLMDRLGAMGSRPLTVADQLAWGPPSAFTNENARQTYAAARRGLDQLSLKELVQDQATELPDAAASIKVGEILATPPEEAAKLLGGEDKLTAVAKAMTEARQALQQAADGLAAGVPTGVLTQLQADVAAGKSPAEVVRELKTTEESKATQQDPALVQKLGHTETLLRLSGDSPAVLAALRLQPGG